MIKHFETKLNEVTELHKRIQIQLSDSTISADMRVKLSKKFASLEQVLECKENIEKCCQKGAKTLEIQGFHGYRQTSSEFYMGFVG